MDRAGSELCAPRSFKPAKSNKVGSLCSDFAKVPFARCVLFTVLMLLRVASCSGKNVQDAQSEKIQAFMGETVILPCTIPVTDELPTVEWSKEGLDPNITFLYRDGCETFDMKNKAYWYRTNLPMNELKDGNISLMISNVQLMDAGKYQCMVVMRKNRRVVKRLELIVGVISEPKISVISDADSGLTLECEATCWPPDPEITFIDDQGNTINAENPKRPSDPRECFNFTRRATVPTTTSRVMCRVHQPQMNKTAVKEIHYVRGGCNCIVPISIAVLVTLGICAFMCFIAKKCESKKTCRQPKDVVYQADPAGLQQQNEELPNQLREKDEEIRKLTAQLNDLRSRQSLVLQQDQPTINASPSTSSPDTSKPVKRSLQKPRQVASAEPPASASSYCTTHEDLARNGSKPEVPRSHAALAFPVNPSSHSKSTPALFITDATNSSSSSSSHSVSNVNRTRSVSHPARNAVKPSRRNTVSGLPSSSYMSNRFSPLEKLNEEESEKLLSPDET